jgi:hypothetical protein
LHDPDYSFDLYTQPESRGDAQTSVEQSMRRARQAKGRAGFSEPGERSSPAAVRRVRVAIGAADDMERLLPKK